MAMLPIDIQVVLSQIAEVGRIQNQVQHGAETQQHAANAANAQEMKQADTHVDTIRNTDGEDTSIKDKEASAGEGQRGSKRYPHGSADEDTHNPGMKDPFKGTIADFKA